MLIEQALYKLLTEDAGVSALVATRVYPKRIGQPSEYPAIVYGLVTRSTDPVLDSRTTTPPNSLYAFVAHSKGPSTQAYMQAKAIEEAIRLCFEGYAGTVSDNSSPQQSVTILGIFFVRSLDDEYEHAIQVQRVGIAFEVRHTQQVPT